MRGYSGAGRRATLWRLRLSMPVTRMYSHPLVRANAGKVALQRGPLVYCLEQADNGANLHELALPKMAELTVRRRRSCSAA